MLFKQYNLKSHWRHCRTTRVIKQTFSLISCQISTLAIDGKSIPVLSTHINGRRIRSRVFITRTRLFRVVGYAIVSIKQKTSPISGIAPLMVTQPSFLLLLCDNPQWRRLVCHVIPLYPLAGKGKLRNCSDCVIRKVPYALCTMRAATRR